MEITYTNPKSNSVLKVTGSSDELVPIVLQLIADTPVPNAEVTVKKPRKKNNFNPNAAQYRAKVIADFANNMSRDDIAAKYPVSRTSINKWIREAGLSNHSTRTPSVKKYAVKTSTPATGLRQHIENLNLG